MDKYYEGILIKEKDVERFYVKTKRSADGCLGWTSQLRTGYGLFSFKGKPVGAHRFALALKDGDIQRGVHACHKCDNRSCVEGQHLFAGTPFDNMRDMMEKDRKGSELTNEMVDVARKRAASGENLYSMAADFEVNPKILLLSIRGHTFSHVETPTVRDVNMAKARKVVKLSHEDVLEILEALKNPYWGQVNDLARKYKVTHGHISQIKTGKFLPAKFVSSA